MANVSHHGILFLRIDSYPHSPIRSAILRPNPTLIVGDWFYLTVMNINIYIFDRPLDTQAIRAGARNAPKLRDLTHTANVDLDIWIGNRELRVSVGSLRSMPDL